MADDQNSSTQSKNTLQKSKVKAGKNVHIGDVNVTIQQSEKKTENSFITVFVIAILLLLLLVAYFYTHPHVPDKPVEVAIKTPENPTIKEEQKKAARPEKKQEVPTPAQFDNHVSGMLIYQGAGVPNIVVSAATGEKTKTNAQGHFQLRLVGTSQITRVHLFFSDPSNIYKSVNLPYDVPKTDITYPLIKI